MDVTCPCQNCSKPITFDHQMDGYIGDCPHCGLPTTLKTEAKAARIQNPKPAVAKSTIICAYLLAFLIPLAGFFSGIWLMTKKKQTHGIICMALSLLGAGIGIAIISAIN